MVCVEWFKNHTNIHIFHTDLTDLTAIVILVATLRSALPLATEGTQEC